ncbi:MAG TPA: TA system VapC family ribonuclease toxin [Vicinamibacterales bacterium]|nr:TA system VapC family ribonuclease toxin [Vicinamibacterales bacterium]
MARVALLDVNVLVALFYAEHVHHELAHDWFADHRQAGWSTCPITENGFVRVASQLTRGETAVRPGVIVEHLRRFCSDDRHHFWPDSVSITDPAVFDQAMIRGHRQLTDIYLLGLARSMDGCLVTFDGTIPVRAVVGATRNHLAVVST